LHTANDGTKEHALWPYCKSKLELNSKKSNSSDAKMFCLHLYLTCLHLKLDFRYSSLSFVKVSWVESQIKL